ncbi:hypothetical protein AB0L70_33815 [Kribbella sp. NPDC051952]|uniref:hypothetical protein n=1 Tax=Kribbella sp. NPDC051952 TaxID=3154851 RepID=UPI00343348FC
MAWGDKKREQKAAKERGKDQDAASELKGKMALGGKMSGKQAARAARAINQGRG